MSRTSTAVRRGHGLLMILVRFTYDYRRALFHLPAAVLVERRGSRTIPHTNARPSLAFRDPPQQPPAHTSRNHLETHSGATTAILIKPGVDLCDKLYPGQTAGTFH